jgi:D-tyrosyl-tRNA(Tyr) deacylase
MRAVVQLVSSASVLVSGKEVGKIGDGIVVFLGVHQEDSTKDIVYLVEKIANLRIFADENGLMNKSLLEVGGAALIVSQFTLFGDCRKGRRPSYSHAARPEKANEFYGEFIKTLKKSGVFVASGEFQAMMEVSLVNKGPVTLLLDSAKVF